METETQEKQVKAVDLASLGNGLYTEVVTIDPTVDGNAPARLIDEALFDEKGLETGKIVYKALLQLPAEGATDFDGNPRPLVEDISGVYKQDSKDGKRKAGEAYKALKINFDLRIAEFADPNANQAALQGRAGKFQEQSINTFTSTKDGQPFSPLFDFAVRLKLVQAPPKNADGSPSSVAIDNEQLVKAVAQHIASGQAVVGVTVKWAQGWTNGVGKSRGKYALQYQRNFPVVNGTHEQVQGTKIKIASFETLA